MIRAEMYLIPNITPTQQTDTPKAYSIQVITMVGVVLKCCQCDRIECGLNKLSRHA